MRSRKVAKWGNLIQPDPAKQPELETLTLLDPNRKVISVLRSDFEARVRSEFNIKALRPAEVVEPRIIGEMVLKASPQVRGVLAALRKRLEKVQALIAARDIAFERCQKINDTEYAMLRRICQGQEQQIAKLKEELAAAYQLLSNGPLGVKNGKDLTDLYCRAYKKIMEGGKLPRLVKGKRGPEV